MPSQSPFSPSKVQHVYSTVLIDYPKQQSGSSTFLLPQWPGVIPSSWTSFLCC
ncbi:hypothetical protein GYMLUDRAFT_778208 [Collybiopsis luxurians FD-317 M1]|uniref:Uncharacterized protein n=1 Tax=Collybiopsis luxurians FD-317 M1 TaxID=944289 RepID=A0A0D0CFE2_9AGAR|nr:hypothetical protein GYMLUDRAFT_778208 [Collybiopsis luxurians FD-317 M1]